MQCNGPWQAYLQQIYGEQTVILSLLKRGKNAPVAAGNI